MAAGKKGKRKASSHRQGKGRYDRGGRGKAGRPKTAGRNVPTDFALDAVLLSKGWRVNPIYDAGRIQIIDEKDRKYIFNSDLYHRQAAEAGSKESQEELVRRAWGTHTSPQCVGDRHHHHSSSSSSSSSSAATGMVPNDITIIDDQVVITTQNKMKKFVKYLAKEFRHKCGGVMRLSWISSGKGFGGALLFTLECGKCGKAYDYGDESLYLRPPTPVRPNEVDNVGMLMVVACALFGRAKYSDYAAFMGIGGLQKYGRDAFIKMVKQVSKASEEVLEENKKCVHQWLRDNGRDKEVYYSASPVFHLTRAHAISNSI
jgi:hypothetical protein